MSSRFEFLGSTAIGQYIPGDSFFHRRDPRARLIIFVVLFIGLVFTPGFSGIGLGLFVLLLIYLMAGLSILPALKGVLRALPFLLILAIIQLLFGSHAGTSETLWEIFGLAITLQSVLSAGLLITRFSVMIILINVSVMILSTAQITAALFHLLKPLEKLRFPVNDFTMVVQITLRYLPMIAQTAEKIAKAQAARGGNWEQRGFNPVGQAKRVLPMLIPLMISSLKKAEIMALAMESRGFNAAEKRSSFYELKLSWIDGVLVLLIILISLTMILWI